MHSGLVNLEAEAALLGAILVNNEAAKLVPSLSAEDFSEPVHQVIFSAATDLIAQGQLADPITLRPFLPEGLEIGPLSGPRYLAHLAASAATILNAPDYGRVVAKAAQMRRLRAQAQELVAATDAGTEVGNIVAAIVADATSNRTGAPATVTLARLLAMKFNAREMLLPPWLPGAGLTMVHAPWSGPRRVLLIDGEMLGELLQRRLEAASRKIELPSPDYFQITASDLSPSGLPDLSDPSSHGFYGGLTKNADLIVLDNVSTVCRGLKENEADSWVPVQNWALSLRRAGKSLLMVHHDGKSGTQRGTSRKEDVLDTVIGLSRPDGYHAEEGASFEVRFEKARGFYGPDAAQFTAQLKDDEWVVEDMMEEFTHNDIRQAHRDGATIRELATMTRKSKSAIGRIVGK